MPSGWENSEMNSTDSCSDITPCRTSPRSTKASGRCCPSTETEDSKNKWKQLHPTPRNPTGRVWGKRLRDVELPYRSSMSFTTQPSILPRLQSTAMSLFMDILSRDMTYPRRDMRPKPNRSTRRDSGCPVVRRSASSRYPCPCDSARNLSLIHI